MTHGTPLGKALDIVVVMDPIASIKIAKDSTFAMLLEAQRRGHRLHYVVPGGLSLKAMRAVADCMTLRVTEDPAQWFDLGLTSQLEFGPGHVVLMRTDPPVDANYIHDTQILGMAQRQGALVVNDPQGLRDFNEKLAALLFPQCCPPTLVSRAPAALKAFVGEHGQAVLKPLDGMGGRSIFRAGAGEPNLNVILETLTDGGRHLAMAQRYLPEIVDGDKRILLVDGEPMDFCLARIPQGDEFRGNLAAGG
ncbi:MAG: glutathione synthase, partial [Thermomonas sp.]